MIKFFLNLFNKQKPIVVMPSISLEFLLQPLKEFTEGLISQAFGVPWSANQQKKHTGLDIAVVAGTEVFAASDGTIKAIGNLDTDGKWAKYVDLEHDTGDLCTAYLHIEPRVSVGQKVRRGDVIGCTANIKGAHLHFNVWKGVYSTLAHRGALPLPDNIGKIDPKTDPAFPANFIDPLPHLIKRI